MGRRGSRTFLDRDLSVHRSDLDNVIAPRDGAGPVDVLARLTPEVMLPLGALLYVHREVALDLAIFVVFLRVYTLSPKYLGAQLVNLQL